jgi:hypothetical protein
MGGDEQAMTIDLVLLIFALAAFVFAAWRGDNRAGWLGAALIVVTMLF